MNQPKIFQKPSPLRNAGVQPSPGRRVSSSGVEGEAISFELATSEFDPTPSTGLGQIPSQTLGVVNIASNEEANPMRRRATFSISSQVQAARPTLAGLGINKLSISPKRQVVKKIPRDKPQMFLDAAFPRAGSRRDSAIDLGESVENSDDDRQPHRSLLRLPHLTNLDICTPIPSPTIEFENPFDNQPALVDRILSGEEEVPVPEQRQTVFDELPFLEEDMEEVQQLAEGMEKDEVIFYQSSMDQIASVFLPKELKTISDLPDGTTVTPISVERKADIVVCIIGVGYVGTELLEGFGSVFNAIGYDVSQKRLSLIAPDFKHLPNVELTSDVTQLARGTHYLISVPTNLHKDNSVNATHLLTAISTVATYARPGSVVVIESSVSVGMTRAFLNKYSDTLHCGMSPERVDPGRKSPGLKEIPKVISGLDRTSLIKIHEIYSQVFDKVVPVTRPEVAEMTKLYENCYRMVNIAYVNEIADACASHGIDANEVIDAASTKPFGFQAFRPGLGIGGHCIPINPYYLFVNNDLPVLEYATTRMGDRPSQLARQLFKEVAPRARDGLRVLVIGVAFKPGQNVISCSPGLSFAAAMSDLGCRCLMFYDPLVPQSSAPWMKRLSSKKFTRKFLDGHFDLVAVCMKQQGVDLSVLDNLRSSYVKYF